MKKVIGGRVLAVLAAVTVALVLPGSAQARENSDHADTQALLNGYLAHAGPGATVYAGNATTEWSLHSGSGVLNAVVPIAPTDHFRIASQTKTFTASVVLQLVDEGKAELDAPIERYLPGVVDAAGYDGNRISVRQILQHTSGIARDATNPRAESDGTYRLAELVRAGLSNPPQFAPGTGWGYSNVNFYIAGMLIEKLTGTTVGDAITDRIIRPLGLTGTKFPKPGDRTLGTPYSRGYTGFRIGGIFFGTETTFTMEMSAISSAGAIVSTLKDMATFDQALADGKVVSAAALAQMRTTVPLPAGSHGSLGDAYGLGLIRVDLPCGGQAWGHAGDLTTGHSSVTMATDDGRHASLVTNTMVQNATAPARVNVVESALCGTPAS